MILERGFSKLVIYACEKHPFLWKYKYSKDEDLETKGPKVDRPTTQELFKILVLIITKKSSTLNYFKQQFSCPLQTQLKLAISKFNDCLKNLELLAVFLMAFIRAKAWHFYHLSSFTSLIPNFIVFSRIFILLPAFP